MHPIVISSALSAGVYATTRAISYMSTQPAPGDRFFNTRAFFAKLDREARDCLGDRWGYLTDVVWDNLWITAFALTIFLANVAPAATVLNIANCIVMVLGASPLIWVTRIALARIFPSASEFVAPRRQ